MKPCLQRRDFFFSFVLMEAHSYSFLDHRTSGTAERETQSTDDRSPFLPKDRWSHGHTTRKNYIDCLLSHCVILCKARQAMIREIDKDLFKNRQTLRKYAQNADRFTCQVKVRYTGEKNSACNNKRRNLNRVTWKLGRCSQAVKIKVRKQITSSKTVWSP